MGKYTGYMIVSDLDNTLIGSNKLISKKNKEAIAFFVKEGGMFGVATGRTVEGIQPYLEDLTINMPCILYNGGGIYDLSTQCFLTRHFVQCQEINPIIEKVSTVRGKVGVQVFTPEGTYLVNQNQYIDPMIKKAHASFEFALATEILKKPCLKIIINGSYAQLLVYKEWLRPFVETRKIHTVFSIPTYLEILPFGINKGSALKELVHLMKVEDKVSIGLGDFDNDIELIEQADYGVVPLNASPKIKEKADFIAVSCDEDLIAYVIDNLIEKDKCKNKKYKER